jgi:hypothetical protein
LHSSKFYPMNLLLNSPNYFSCTLLSTCMRHLHSLTSGQKTTLTKETGHFVMPIILCYRIHTLNFSKNRHCTAYR